MADRHSADELLIAALAGGKTNEQAATASGVSVRTVRRRKKEPEFMRRVRQARAEMVAAASGKLADHMTAATDTLVTLLTDPDSGVKLRAATKIVELGLRATEVVDLEQRLAELERAQGGNTDGATMGSLKGRIDRLSRGGLGEKARLREHYRRQFKERKAVFTRFLDALPDEFDTPELSAILLPWVEPLLLNGWVDEKAPLIARMVCGFDWHGWFPSPLPAE